MSYNYATRIFLALFAAKGPVEFMAVMDKMLEAIALLAAFLGAFVAPLDPGDYDDSLASRLHLVSATFAQVLGLFTTFVAVLVLIQLSFYKPAESVYFFAHFGIVATVPIVTLASSLLFASVASLLRVYLYSTDDAIVWKTCVGILAPLFPGGMFLYAYMDRVMRNVRLNALKRPGRVYSKTTVMNESTMVGANTNMGI